jgi:hypothetical protein
LEAFQAPLPDIASVLMVSMQADRSTSQLACLHAACLPV